MKQLTIQEVIAVIGVVTAFLTALISLFGLRWSKQVFDAKDAQMDTLKQQLEALRDRTPAELQKQMIALKELMESEVSRLRASLDESNEMLRQKSAEISDDKRAIATALGYGRLFFGIDDGELLVRRLHGLLYNGTSAIDYGEQELAIWSFYLNAIRLIMPNDEACAGIVTGNPEWMLDDLIMPLLACMRFRSLKSPAREALDMVCKAVESTAFAHEVPLYRDAIEHAEKEFNFLAGSLPLDLTRRLIQKAKVPASGPPIQSR
jgi:hypothetical protein